MAKELAVSEGLVNELRQAYEEYDKISARISFQMGNAIAMTNTKDLDDEGLLRMAIIVAKNHYKEQIIECKKLLEDLNNEATGQAH